jgi:rfaE bifunctional protein kinase chain/domain/rfaE bifunctional protein nucleotidyltransferase chain/domain
MDPREDCKGDSGLVHVPEQVIDAALSRLPVGPAPVDTPRSSKIWDLDDLARHLQALRAAGKRIVHSHGVFDLLHLGHIRHFEQAKRLGDVLIVTITADEHVNKGPHRPAFPEAARAEAVAALGAVDYVAVNRWPLSVETILLLKPDVYVKGSDYQVAANDVTGGIGHETDAVRRVGGEIRFTNDVVYSSSHLLNRHLSMFSPQAASYLDNFRSRYSAEAVREYLESLRGLRVLVVGEAILDEYVYCNALGKSAKEPILAMRYVESDLHAGGALAIANHIADFCDHVDLVTYVGDRNTREDFIRSRLKPAVTPTFITKRDSPTIVKRRYVEKYMVTKLLEIYEVNDEPMEADESRHLCDLLSARLGDYDVAVAADFGHGLLGADAASLLSEESRFLAVNTQINAANIGFHTISKYPRADYVCIHEGELRLDQRSRVGDLRRLVTDLGQRLSCGTIMVTRGTHGTLLYRRDDGFFECPSFATKVVDRTGAGDAVLALTSLCAARGLPADVIGFVANMVGAQAVTIVGNATSIERVPLLKSVESVLR